MTDAAIEVAGLHKEYRDAFGRRRKHALAGVDLHVAQGEMLGVLGPNGAGKTTLLNLAMGLIQADRGTVRVFGRDVTRRFPMPLRRRMNMCSGTPNFPWCLSVSETLDFFALLYGVPGAVFRERKARLVDWFELGPNLHTRYDELSTGNKQRLAFAKPLVTDPEILLRAEPTLGLDPDISRKLRRRIRSLHAGGGKTILLTTHDMREAGELCGRIAFVRDGRIFALGTRDELLARTRTPDLEEAFVALAHP